MSFLNPATFYNRRAAGAFDPANLFVAGDLGWIYDINDLSTLWADTAATIPAVMNGRVARQDDKSLAGLNRVQATLAARPWLRGTPTGPNLHTGFSSPGTGWSAPGATATATTASTGVTASPAAVPGTTYKVEFTVTRSAGTVAASMGGVSTPARGSAGRYVEYFTAVNTNPLVFTGSGFTGTVTAVGVHNADTVTTPYYLHHNGSTWMQIASTNFTGKTAFSVAMAIARYRGAVVTGQLMEMGPTIASNNGTMNLSSATDTAGAAIRGTSGPAATVSVSSAAASTPAGTHYVQSALFNLGGGSMEQNLKLRVNGVNRSDTYANTITVQGGNFGTWVIYFGARNAGASNQLQGLEGSSVGISKLLSEANMRAVEQWCADRGAAVLGSNADATAGVAPNYYTTPTFWYDGDSSNHYSFDGLASNGEDTIPANNNGDPVARLDSAGGINRVAWRSYNDVRRVGTFSGLELDDAPPGKLGMRVYPKPAPGAPVVTPATLGQLHTATNAAAILLLRVHTASSRGDYFDTMPYGAQGGWLGLHVYQPAANMQFFAMNWDTGADYAFDSVGVPPGAWAVATVVHKGGRLYIRVNGAIRGNVASGNTGYTEVDVVINEPESGGVPNEMDLAQLVTFNSAYTDQQLSNIEKALCDKLGVTFAG